VVWDSVGQDGSGDGIFGRRFTSAGAAAGAEFQVNTYTTNDQFAAAVAADAEGDFVVVWHSEDQDGSDRGIFGLRFTSAGAAVGTEFQVNTYTTYEQGAPRVAADADGDFVVVWQGHLGYGYFDVFGQRFTSAGAAVGAEFQVNTYTTSDQYLPEVAAAGDGGFVVVWMTIAAHDQDGSGSGVFGQRYQPIVPPGPPPIPALSSGGRLLLGMLLVLPMIRGLRRRINPISSPAARSRPGAPPAAAR
jgi:hypothetical protein